MLWSTLRSDEWAPCTDRRGSGFDYLAASLVIFVTLASAAAASAVDDSVAQQGALGVLPAVSPPQSHEQRRSALLFPLSTAVRKSSRAKCMTNLRLKCPPQQTW